MTSEQSEVYWQSEYPAVPPLSDLFRNKLTDTWFRVHSLPESKRYPSNTVDLAILLHRQNTLITDLLGTRPQLLLVTGEYDFASVANKKGLFSPEGSIQDLAFTELKPFILNQLEPDPRIPDGYAIGDLYRIVFVRIDWQPEKWNSILEEIAQGELRAFFISVANKYLIAPYDGGVDVIVKSTPTRNFYKKI
ncbi:DUF3885 domain-containing protein [Hymenobacter guriensis]|uniref:DUF3885 domain-containing protein n=1 Tax=Hymenobacter guriensis TaxID=2793065 RepID=A0ABS0KW57_9BACT|nr:hypothetical protein [Hymenobacter guriensis]MBG8552091.1 hypothetical protein [Hymenobacter guriensis]